MSSTPLGTRTLRIEIEGEEYTADVSSVTIETAPLSSDFVTFADAAAGGARQYTLKFKATQDPADPDSIWNLIWDHAGEDADVVINPYGGASPSVTNPQFEGTLTITEPDGVLLGGDANASTSARFTMDVSWVYKAKPARVIED
jgi:hypothetical protein